MLVVAVAGASAGPVSVRVAGREVSSSVSPTQIDGALMLPAAFLTECLGMRVEPASEPGQWRIISYGRYLRVAKNDPNFVLGDARHVASSPTEMLDDRLYVPAEMIQRAFGVPWARSAQDGVYELSPAGAVVRQVRAGSHDDRLRVVFDVSAPTPFRHAAAKGRLVLEVPPPADGDARGPAVRLYTFEDPMRPSVRLYGKAGGWTRVVAEWDDGGEPWITTLRDPFRIVADVRRKKPPPAAIAKAVQPRDPLPPPVATPWAVRHFSTERGTVRVFVLRASPTALVPALAGATILKRAPVSTIARRAHAPAAVNGGYFDTSGSPLGMLVIDGEWVKHPTRNRCALGITRAGKAVMGRQRFVGSVRLGNTKPFELGGLNASHWKLDKAMLYTRRWGNALNGSSAKARVVISGARKVTQVVADGGAVAIPDGGYVLSAGGETGAKLGATPVGAEASICLGAVPHWPELRHAIGAGPQLVKDGLRRVTVDEELFRPDVRRVCSRTAVGIDGDGNVILAAAEAALARGLQLWELASVMWKMGCRDAMALDGGGSTTVYSKGRVVNHPADGRERAVSNALLVFGVPPNS